VICTIIAGILMYFRNTGVKRKSKEKRGKEKIMASKPNNL